MLREKIASLREEIANIRRLNDEVQSENRNSAETQVARGQRNERLQAIQKELVQLADLGRKVVSSAQMKEKHDSRLRALKH